MNDRETLPVDESEPGPDNDGLGELQQRVMQVVWQLRSATVAEVHQTLASSREIAYTTVLSTLRNLEKRGYLSHTVEGKAHRFHPVISREQHTSVSVSRLVRTLFDGEPERLMCHLLGESDVDRDQLARIRRLIGNDRTEQP